MTTFMQPNGWDEIQTIRVRLTQNSAHYMGEVKGWIETDWRMDFSDRKTTCDCCGVPWQALHGDVWKLQTNQGAKVVCDHCKKRLGDLEET